MRSKADIKHLCEEYSHDVFNKDTMHIVTQCPQIQAEIQCQQSLFFQMDAYASFSCMRATHQCYPLALAARKSAAQLTLNG